MFEPAHKRDFDAVYNLPVPHSYYGGLAPTCYRMPDVIAELLRLIAPRLSEAGVTRGDMQVVDFACGYGAIGAVLRHHLSMEDVFAYYANDANDNTASARAQAFYAARERPAPGIRLTGLDIAENALNYAHQLGFVDATFAEDLVAAQPSAELTMALGNAHLIVESGGVGEIQATIFDRILSTGARPWVIRSPRPDVDWRSLDAVFLQHGYVEEPIGPRVQYRRCLGTAERDEVNRLATQYGHASTEVFHEDFIAVQMTLARPRPDAQAWPLTALLGGSLEGLN